jgi:hypothetical protein
MNCRCWLKMPTSQTVIVGSGARLILLLLMYEPIRAVTLLYKAQTFQKSHFWLGLIIGS